MRNAIRGALLASAIPFLAIASTVAAITPAEAQAYGDVSFDAFHDQLSGYGDWLYSDRWGEVWRPSQQDQDPAWRPYSVGHWAYTDDYGWTWISNEGPWADIAYHYGRWVADPDDGWLWLPGYVWSPAWVVWRSAGPNVGWMPMPPDDAFLGDGGGGVSINVSFGDWADTGGFYGYSRWYGREFDADRFDALWTFVPTAHVADPVYRNYVVPRTQVTNIIRDSHNVTNYTVVNNVIINRSVNVTEVRAAGGRPVTPVRAASVLRTTRWVAPVNRGVQVQTQMRQARPRGNGAVNSAPAPTAAQIRTLSNRPVPTRGPSGSSAPHHVFNQASVASLQPRRQRNGQPGGQPNGAAAPANGPEQQSNQQQLNQRQQPPALANNPSPRESRSGQPQERRGVTPPTPVPQQNEAARRPPQDFRTPRQELDRGAQQPPVQRPDANESARSVPRQQRPEAMRAMPERQRPEAPPAQARSQQPPEAMRAQQPQRAAPGPEARPQAKPERPDRPQGNGREQRKDQ